MSLIPLLALLVGLIVGQLLAGEVPDFIAPYIGVTVLASIDSILGGTRSHLDGKFQTDIFVTGFFSNIVAAMFLVWLGDHIGIGLMQVAAVVFGIRIFTNLSLIRRIIITRITENRERKKREVEQSVWSAEEN